MAEKLLKTENKVGRLACEDQRSPQSGANNLQGLASTDIVRLVRGEVQAAGDNQGVVRNALPSPSSNGGTSLLGALNEKLALALNVTDLSYAGNSENVIGEFALWSNVRGADSAIRFPAWPPRQQVVLDSRNMEAVVNINRRWR